MSSFYNSERGFHNINSQLLRSLTFLNTSLGLAYLASVGVTVDYLLRFEAEAKDIKAFLDKSETEKKEYNPKNLVVNPLQPDTWEKHKNPNERSFVVDDQEKPSWPFGGRELHDAVKKENSVVRWYYAFLLMQSGVEFPGSMSAGVVYRAYEVWCRDTGIMQPLGMKKFRRTLGRMGGEFVEFKRLDQVWIYFKPLNEARRLFSDAVREGNGHA